MTKIFAFIEDGGLALPGVWKKQNTPNPDAKFELRQFCELKLRNPASQESE
jgi:hypothetical protein